MFFQVKTRAATRFSKTLTDNRHVREFKTLSNDFKLFWVVFVKKRQRNAHNAVVIVGDVLNSSDFNGIEVIITGIFFRGILLKYFGCPVSRTSSQT